MRQHLTILFTAIAIMAASLSASAQKIRFVDTANSWQTSGGFSSSCMWDRTARIANDTVLSGTTYKRFKYSIIKFKVTTAGCNADDGKGYFVRQDGNGMVYYRAPAIDAYEHVLYNYNLVPGDTISYSYSMYPGGSVADSVVSLDSILIGTTYHRVWDFVSATGRGNRAYSVIEGVGCTNHPLYPAFAGSCYDFYENLKCFSQSGLVHDFLMRMNTCAALGTNYYINCDYIPFPTSISNNITTQNVRVYPNPSVSLLNVDIDPFLITRASVTITDMTGHPVYTCAAGSLTQSPQINTASWPNGIYMLRVDQGNGTISRETVVICR
ncbi:MAG: T9SS type A sorting domain-containing protein [Flavipsychrobacter sp.]|nr:T9SS type A sorting domain-containing protein [Flavipsychrobacter sp.]